MAMAAPQTANGQEPDSTRTGKKQAADSTANGQIMARPDTVRAAAKPPPNPHWTYTAGVDGAFSSGNVNRRLLTVRLGVAHENPNSIWGFYSSPRYQYGTNNNVLQEREFFLDFNNTWFYAQQDMYGLLFGIYEQSNLRQISHRLNAGVGVGWKIVGGRNVPSTRFQLSLSNAILRESTDFIANDDVTAYRNSTRLKFRVEIVKDRLIVQSTTLYQPAFNRKYLRWNSISQLVFKTSKHLSLTATLDNSYESFNVEGVARTQLNATVGLSYSASR